jgi:hypothetical protein
MRDSALACAALLIALASAQASGAGTLITTETRKLGVEAPRVQRTEVRVDGDRLRVEPEGSATTVIYRGDRRLVWLLNHEEKTFLQVDRGTTTAIAQNLKAANEALRERTRNLPPEQRQAIERMLDGTLGAPPAPEPAITTRDTGRRDRVRNIECAELEVLRGVERVAEVCIAEFEAAGITRATFDVVRELALFLRESVAAMAPRVFEQDGMDALDSFQQVDGVPLRVRAFEEGKPATETMVTAIEPRSFVGADFELPEGYRGGFSLGGSRGAAEAP